MRLLKQEQARRWTVSGRVQGVGYRYFVRRAAVELGVRGYAKNLEDGRVEVYGIGSTGALGELEGRLRVGPLHADVRHVESSEAALLRLDDFQIR